MPSSSTSSRRRATVRSTAILIAGIALAPASAQVTPQPAPPTLPSQSDISRARVGLPPPEAGGYDLHIQAPEKTAVPKAVDTIDFHLTRVSVTGATVLPQATVDTYFTKLVGVSTTLDAIRAAAAALEQRYHAEGYFLTRVFVPPQRLDGGRLTIRVVEGYIEAIDVHGMDDGSRRAVRAILAPLLQRRPIDLASVERRLLILNDLPGFTATGVLKQGEALGASVLVINLVKTRNAFQASLGNGNSRLLGPWVYGASANLNRAAGLPGALTFGVSASGAHLAASQSGSARYTTKIGNSGLIGSVGTLVARAAPRGSLRPLDIYNALESYSGRLRYPLIRSRAQSLFLEGGLSINRSRTKLLGQKLIDDRTTDGDIALLYQQNGFLGGNTSASIDLFHGLTILGASTRGNPLPSVRDFDPAFIRIVLQAQRLQRLPGRFSAFVSLQGQFTGDKLLTGELVAFGGPAIGRGFDPSTITGDRGFGGLGELRYDLRPPARWIDGLQLYAFVDGARATSLAASDLPEVVQSLNSAGAGVRLFHRFGSIDLQAAQAFRRMGGADARPNPRVLLIMTVSR